MKKWAVLITVITLLAAGIFSAKKPADELVFWTLQMRDFSAYMEKVIGDFEVQNPEIKIKWVDIPFSEGEKRTLASILSSNPPDLVNLNPDFSALLAKKGTLYEISDKDLAQFSPEIVKNMKFNGKNYFIPWYATSALTFVNKKSLPRAPRSYNDVLTYCRSGKTGVLMFNFAENDSMLKLLNKYGINSPEKINSPRAIDLYKTLQAAYESNCFPKESLTQTHRESLEKYMAGEVLIFEGGANFLNMIKENAPKTFSQTAVSPQLVGETGRYNFSMMNFILPLKSKKHAEALKFALFLTNTENQLELGRLTNVLATNEKALNNEFYTRAPSGDIFAQARVLSAKQLKKLQPQPFYQNRKEVILLINNATQKILLKQDSIENILTQLRRDLESVE